MERVGWGMWVEMPGTRGVGHPRVLSASTQFQLQDCPPKAGELWANPMQRGAAHITSCCNFKLFQGEGMQQAFTESPCCPHDSLSRSPALPPFPGEKPQAWRGTPKVNDRGSIQSQASLTPEWSSVPFLTCPVSSTPEVFPLGNRQACPHWWDTEGGLRDRASRTSG